MSNGRIMQTLRNQALRRAIGELNAALEAIEIHYDDKGNELPDDMTIVIQQCIQEIENNI